MTAPNKSLAQALATGAKRYIGQLCDKHPEAGGERNAKNRGCVLCNRDKMRARRAADPEYWSKLSRENYRKNRDRVLERTRAQGRERRTGMDAEVFKLLYAMQDGKCALCERRMDGRSCHADHDHETKEIRGLLCSTCNQAEGLIRRSGLSAHDFGLKLSRYLDYPPARYIAE